MRSAEEHATASAIIQLMRGVVYREQDDTTWTTLDRSAPPIRDHFAAIGVDVVIDDTEGYAYLQARPEADGEEPLPRLVNRRTLGYNLSLLLVLLRKRLVEFETVGAEGKLVLSRDQIVEMLRLFFTESTNEARVVDQADTTIRWLTAEEQALYQDLVTDRLGERIRLEQERIDWNWAARRLSDQLS